MYFRHRGNGDIRSVHPELVAVFDNDRRYERYETTPAPKTADPVDFETTPATKPKTADPVDFDH